jgi:hypothetical protein
MPNWCTNILDVTGDIKQLRAFNRKVYHTEIASETTHRYNKGNRIYIFDFEGTIPMPSELHGTSSPAYDPEQKAHQAELAKKYGHGNWLEWAIANWSTKWNPGDASKRIKVDGGYRYGFDTAWCPPDNNWLLTTSKMFPGLAFTLYFSCEGGLGCGKTVFQSGDADCEELSAHDWNMEFDDNYMDEYEFITGGDYPEVVSRYVSQGELENYSLADYLLTRLSDKDLPLFIHFEWCDIEDAFEERLKNGRNTCTT